MEWSEKGLRAVGFDGFVPVRDFDRTLVPQEPGVYVVVRPSDEAPTFLDISPAGHFKGRDPTVPASTLAAAWVEGARVLYIGKASAGARRRRGLRRRLTEYVRHGRGELVGHWGGRYLWQLHDHSDLLLAWRPETERDPEAIEGELIATFRSQYDRRPFANRKSGSAPSGARKASAG